VIPRLHLVTDDGILAQEGFLSRAGSALEAGGGEVALHLRGPRTSGRGLYTLARALREPAEAAGSLLLVNDRLDVALTLDLPGAHLGQRSLSPRDARALLGPHRLLGLSAHSRQEARLGEDGLVDFLLVGTIFPTPSHRESIPGGVDRIAEVGAVTHRPLLAIGGVTPERVPEVMAAGAHGVAVRGGVWETMDPAASVRVYLGAMGPVENGVGERETGGTSGTREGEG